MNPEIGMVQQEYPENHTDTILYHGFVRGVVFGVWMFLALPGSFFLGGISRPSFVFGVAENLGSARNTSGEGARSSEEGGRGGEVGHRTCQPFLEKFCGWRYNSAKETKRKAAEGGRGSQKLI